MVQQKVGPLIVLSSVVTLPFRTFPDPQFMPSRCKETLFPEMAGHVLELKPIPLLGVQSRHLVDRIDDESVWL